MREEQERPKKQTFRGSEPSAREEDLNNQKDMLCKFIDENVSTAEDYEEVMIALDDDQYSKVKDKDRTILMRKVRGLIDDSKLGSMRLRFLRLELHNRDRQSPYSKTKGSSISRESAQGSNNNRRGSAQGANNNRRGSAQGI